MASEGNKDVPNEALSVDQSSITGVKRKRGRPRKYEYPVYELPQKVQPLQSAPPLLHCTKDGSSMASHTSGGSVHGNWSAQPRNSATASLQGSSGKDDFLGRHFVGKLTKKVPGFSLITVKVKDNQVLKGWVPDETNLRPITPKDDLAPELPMLRPSQVRKRASAIHMQPALPVPMHLEDVTLAKPLQMRRPVEKTTARPRLEWRVSAGILEEIDSYSMMTSHAVWNAGRGAGDSRGKELFADKTQEIKHPVGALVFVHARKPEAVCRLLVERERASMHP